MGWGGLTVIIGLVSVRLALHCQLELSLAIWKISCIVVIRATNLHLETLEQARENTIGNFSSNKRIDKFCRLMLVLIFYTHSLLILNVLAL